MSKPKHEEQKQKFQYPKFDVEKYIETDLRNSYSLLLSSFYGIIIGLISLYIKHISLAVAIAVAILSAFGIKFLFLYLNIGYEKIDKKYLVYCCILYLITWFAIFIFFGTFLV